MWRSSQPLPFQIARLARQGIRTIINLRGSRVCGSYALEVEACQRHGVVLVDFPVNSRDAPQPKTIHAACAMFETLAYPALMHCKSGADRAGLMSVLYLMCSKGETASRALRHLSFRFGHVRQGKTGILDYFFETYLADTAARPMDFLTWVDEVYDPVDLKAQFMSQWWANVIVDRVLRRE